MRARGWTAARSAAWVGPRLRLGPRSWPGPIGRWCAAGRRRVRLSGMEWTRWCATVHVVSVIGNNGIWALEKHPMEMLYGYSVVASCCRNPLRRGGDRPRRARGTGVDAGRGPPRAGACFRCGAARCGERADRRKRRVPPPLESGLSPRPRASVFAHETTRKSVQTRTLARP